MVNSISVVLFIVLLAVAAFSAAMGSYYYSTLSESLKQKAENAISSFDYYRTEAEYYDNARAVVAGEPNSDKLEVEYFFYIGGNDSMDTVSKLSRYAARIGSSIRVIGEPKTIDNDLVHTDHTPGYGLSLIHI